MTKLRSLLGSLDQLDPPSDLWDDIQVRADARAKAPTRGPAVLLAIALVTALAIGGAAVAASRLIELDLLPPPEPPAPIPTAPFADEPLPVDICALASDELVSDAIGEGVQVRGEERPPRGPHFPDMRACAYFDKDGEQPGPIIEISARQRTTTDAQADTLIADFLAAHRTFSADHNFLPAQSPRFSQDPVLATRLAWCAAGDEDSCEQFSVFSVPPYFFVVRISPPRDIGFEHAFQRITTVAGALADRVADDPPTGSAAPK